MKKLFLLFLLLILSSCSNNSNQETNQIIVQEESFDTVIVAFGDSLTEGLGVERYDAYPAQLETQLRELGYNVKVYNAGFSGETSSAALERVEWSMQLKPDIVIVNIGSNDAMRGINLQITKSNIEKIVDYFNSRNVTVVLSGMITFENLGEEYTNEFENMYVEISKEKDVYFIPFFLEGVAGNSTLNNRDEIHPNKEGYEKIVRENIIPVILKIFES